MATYSITREGQDIGSFELSQIQEGLESGYFQPTDWGWCEGMSDWQPLPALIGTGPLTNATPKPISTAPKAKPIQSPASVAIAKPTAASPASINPYAAPTANTQGTAYSTTVHPTILIELTRTKPWVRLISVLMWIVCILVFVPIVGNLLIGIFAAKGLADSGNGAAGFGMLIFGAFFFGVSALLIIYPTVKLTKYATNIGILQQSRSMSDLAAALAEQRRFWKFYGIIALIYVILGLVFFLLMITLGGIGALAR